MWNVWDVVQQAGFLTATAIVIAASGAAALRGGAGPAAEPGSTPDFVVAPDGSDRHPGTQERPFATPERARNAAREVIAEGLKKPLTVALRGGTYSLGGPLVFGPEDSGTPDCPVTYAAWPGETPVLSGGRRITGWKAGATGLWTADLRSAGLLPPPGAAAEADTRPVRSLFINGRRAVRARTPYWQLKGADLSQDLTTYVLTFEPGVIRNWANPADIEALIPGDWEVNRKRVLSVDEKSGTATLAPPHAARTSWNQPKAGRWCVLENVREFLTEPGRWYFDGAAGTITYWPLPGEDRSRAEAFVPRLTTLVEVAGAPGRPVTNLHFRGLRFQHAAWPLPAHGYHGVQATHYVEGDSKTPVWTRVSPAVRWTYVEASSLRDGAVEHCDGSGIDLGAGCHGNVIEGNLIRDLGGTGVLVGLSSVPKDAAVVPRQNRIANNYVQATGVEVGAVGVWVGFAQKTVIAHNVVCDLPYSGISVGWQWNDAPTPCRENLIEYNHIHDVMQHLADGGGIYTLGLQPGTVIRSNHIHDVERSRYAQGSANNGMFIDEGSRGFFFEKNVVYRTSGGAVRFNACARDWHTWGANALEGVEVPASATPGKVGLALQFSGAGGFRDLPHAADLDPAEFTLECWLKLGRFPVGADPRRWVAGKNGNEWSAGHYSLVVNGREVGAYFNIAGGRGRERFACTSTAPLKLDTWQHLAVTYDGKDLKVYVGGAAAASAPVNEARQPARGPFRIGGRPDGFAPGSLSGAVDEVRLYKRALTAGELARHASSPDQIEPEAALVGYWPFEDAPPPAPRDDTIANAGLEPPYRRLIEGEAGFRQAFKPAERSAE